MFVAVGVGEANKPPALQASMVITVTIGMMTKANLDLFIFPLFLLMGMSGSRPGKCTPLSLEVQSHKLYNLCYGHHYIARIFIEKPRLGASNLEGA